MSKTLLHYPRHPQFEELLNSCGSMTSQLEELGQQLTVTLLQEGIINNERWRIITLNLNDCPVILASSHCSVNAEFFCNLLKNASVTPIGKFLFAPQSRVTRDLDMQLELISRNQSKTSNLYNYLETHNYCIDQQFWQRSSTFHYQRETLKLVEILLPELESFLAATK